jgi:hypothetical protein
MYVQTNVGMLCCVGAALASVEDSPCMAQTGTTLHSPLPWRTYCWNFYWKFCSFVWPPARIKWTAASRVLLNSLSSNSLPLMKPEGYKKQWEKFHIRRFLTYLQMWSSFNGQAVPNNLKVCSSIISGIF